MISAVLLFIFNDLMAVERSKGTLLTNSRKMTNQETNFQREAEEEEEGDV